uniref:Alanine racemase N-terminal domain-containing protein n=1 Tax=uncultured prokaryote TaxID=198431 RepID=A0A0H5QMW2_9ZZZZ|nr:hypothetical protein [uncultured prokaryote]
MRNEDFSRLEISLSGCLENYGYFRSKLNPGTKLLVLVKANAYGHGAVEYASMLQEAHQLRTVRSETPNFSANVCTEI